MKKISIILSAALAVIALALPLTTQAQVKVTNVWSFGPEAGVSISKYGNDASRTDFKPGAVTGLFVTYSIINTFGITTKFLYSERGATLDNNNKQTLQYVEIPVIGRFFLNKEGSIRPNVFFGPSVAFLAGARNRTNNTVEQVENYKDSFNNVDFGLTGGLGCNFRIHRETYLVLDGRYTHGISDISKANTDVNNKSFALTAGLQFGF